MAMMDECDPARPLEFVACVERLSDAPELIELARQHGDDRFRNIAEPVNQSVAPAV